MTNQKDEFGNRMKVYELERLDEKIRRYLKAQARINKIVSGIRAERVRLITPWEVGDLVHYDCQPAVIVAIEACGKFYDIKIAFLTKSGRPSKKWYYVRREALLKSRLEETE